MRTRARTNQKTDVHLESLEAREAPTVGLAGAWQAALAQAQNRSSHAIGVQVMPRALAIPRPGSAVQSHAASLGASNANVVAARTATPPALALAQARRAAVRAAAPTVRTATPNRAQLNSAWAVRSTMRAPVAVLPSNPPATTMTPPVAPIVTPTADAGTAPQSLPANVSGPLNTIYQEFQKSSTLPIYTGPGSIQVDGSNVGVMVHGNGQGAFSDLVGALQNLGMEINATSDVTWTVAGMLPISALPTAAQTPQTLSITPMYTPILRT